MNAAISIGYSPSRINTLFRLSQEEARVSEGVVGGGREVLFFVPSSIGSCCSLLVACLLGVSRISRERSSHLHLFGLSSLELGASLCRSVRERD